MMHEKLRKFDPRRGEDFVLGRFSSLRSGFLVVDSVPKRRFFGLATSFDGSFQLHELVRFILACQRSTAPLGFIICDPKPHSVCFPPAEPVAWEEHLPTRTLCGFYPPSRTAIEALLTQRARDEAWRQWIIGSCFDRFRPDRQRGFSYEFILEQPARLGCVFWQEANWLTLMTRVFPGIDDLLRATFGDSLIGE